MKISISFHVKKIIFKPFEFFTLGKHYVDNNLTLDYYPTALPSLYVRGKLLVIELVLETTGTK